MGSFSDATENKILDHIVGKTSFTMPTAYVALATAAITDAHTGATFTEVANANSYARVATAGADWNAAAAGAIDNANDITFPEASGSWGEVTHFCLCDSGTWGAGAVLGHSILGAAKTIGSGDTPKFAAGDLDLTLD